MAEHSMERIINFFIGAALLIVGTPVVLLLANLSDSKKEKLLNGLLKVLPTSELDGLIEVIKKEQIRRAENGKN